MKTLKKLSAFLLTLMLCVGIVSVPVKAASNTATQDGLQITLTTDKEEYSDGEEIKLTLIVKNTNTEAVTDIELESFISDGYELTEESIQALKELVKLGAGAEKSVPITVVKKDVGTGTPDTPKSDNSSDNVVTSILKSPNTADNNNIALWVTVFLAGVALIGVTYAIKNKKAKQALSVMLCVAVAASTFVTTSVPVSAMVQNKTITLEKTVKYAGENVTFKANFSYTLETPDVIPETPDVVPETPDVEPVDEYKLVWSDEFDGTELNREDWNVELHDPDWVNAELQAYVDSADNITVKDGKLIITPIQTKNADGTYSYTSGRISTQGKETFKYGKFEARVKVPTGKGYLPAFWLMANDENLYGQWPRCGEIDIMEVWGSDTDTTYGTIHYGNPHGQSQSTYSLSDGTFADEFHTFTCEWEPGEIKWYVDGILFHTENDWYSAVEGGGELTYPAPFDQPFYVILNLAVGGEWVGYPDDETFVSDTYEVDYVRVYQKDSYDENVTKPEKEVVLRDPDANGNYIINGDFAVAEDLTDDAAWKFLLAAGGAGTAAITNEEMVISSTNAGTEDYSVQLVQANLPMQQGGTYTLTFDAWADADRTMKVGVSAPDLNYARYLEDQKVSLTTTKQSYTCTFNMTKSDDANGRLEFNLGNQGSTAGVHIDNVVLKQTSYQEPSDEVVKTVLPDGNYVYNGQFDEGAGRMEFWDVTNNAGAQVSVTNTDNIRKLMIVAPEGTSAEKPVIISQSDLAMSAEAEYIFSAELKGDAGKTINVTYAGNNKTYNLDGTVQTISEKFVQAAGNAKNVVFTITQPGTYYIDNVRIDEDKLIKNGSFSAGFSGFEPFVDSGIASDVSYVVDSLNEDNAADFTISNTGTQDWQIQLKQNNVELEKDQWYKLSLNMKSSIVRDVSVAIQRNGNIYNDDWTPYLQKVVTLGTDYQTYEFEFQMTEDTDLASVFNVTMGAVGGKQITEQHRICIDDIVLEKIEAPEQEEIVAGENLIKNADFASGMDSWKVDAYDGGAAETTTGDGKITLNITGLGTVSSCVKLNQKDITLEQGATYKMKFAIKSSEARGVKWGLMTDTYNWYDGQDLDLSKDTTKYVDYEFTVTQATTNTINFYVSMGQMCNLDSNYQEMPDSPIDTPLSTIEISEISLVKLSGGTGSDAEDGSGDEETTPVADELIVNGNFASGKDSWIDNCGASWVDAVATATYSENGAEFDITNVGTQNWHVQLEQGGLTLIKDKQYTLEFVVEVDRTRDIEYAFLDSVDPNNPVSYAGEVVTVEAGAAQTITKTITMNNESDDAARFQISMGKVGETYPAGKVTIKSVSLKMVDGSEGNGATDEGTAGEESNEPIVLTFDNFSLTVSGGDAAVNMFERGAFNNEDVTYVEGGENVWDYWTAYPSGSDTEKGTLAKDNAYANGVMTVSIADEGTVAHGIQLVYKPQITFEKDVTYILTFDVTSSANRKIVSQFQDASWANIGWTQTSLTAGEPQTVEVKITPSEAQAANPYNFCLNLGKM